MGIKLDLETRRGRALHWIAGRLLRLIVGGLGRTWRVEIVGGRDVYDALLRDSSPSLLAFWHNRSVMAASLLPRHVHRRGRRLALLVSQSRDGELLVALARAWDLHLVRGSTTRGGRGALWSLLKAIRSGLSPVVVPDGPTGPVYEVKSGVLLLSQATQTPIVPLGLAADRAWHIRSWDRLIVPKPFARVTMVWGERWTVAPGDEVFESDRRDAKARLDEATRRAEAAFGAEAAFEGD